MPKVGCLQCRAGYLIIIDCIGHVNIHHIILCKVTSETCLNSLLFSIVRCTSLL